MKKYIPYLLLLLACVAPHTASAFENHSPLLVLDCKDPVIPKRFRHTDQPLYAQDVECHGIEQLRMIGSGAFTIDQLIEASEIADGPITVVDLRQESHCYVNGLPVSLYGCKNWANIQRSPEEIREDEQELIHTIQPEDNLILYHIRGKGDVGEIVEVQEMHLNPFEIVSEEEAVERLGFSYQRFYVTNHMHPSPDQVDAFMAFLEERADNEWLYFHCRGGSGRTTTFMVMTDILMHGDTLSLEEIIARHRALGGKNLLDTQPKKAYRRETSVNRAEFIRSFYTYVTSFSGHDRPLWSEWISGNIDKP